MLKDGVFKTVRPTLEELFCILLVEHVAQLCAGLIKGIIHSSVEPFFQPFDLFLCEQVPL